VSLIQAYMTGSARRQKPEARGAGSVTRARYAAMPSPGTLALATRGLRKSYGARLALDGLDLSVPSGVVYGFLGPNGAGKTTTMRLLTGLLHPDGGSIELLGRPFTARDRRALFDVGALVESPSFYPYLSGRANLEALAADGAQVPRGRIDELLELVGLRDRARDRVSGYSLGMKQRLGIAGALLSDPKLLLLDEPANGLDPAGIVAMRETLRHLAASGKTVFVSSHLLAEVQVLADVVGIVARGRLVREGSLASLLTDQGVVRVRVPRGDAEPARAALAGLAAVDVPQAGNGAEDQWLTVHVQPGRASDINRRLAEAGIYASGLESGTDLELLFLELTGGGPSSEGTMQGIGEPRQPGGSAA
jgi:ABC-2 type transport system ATP-binding protein